jgi:hypothetical protein
VVYFLPNYPFKAWRGAQVQTTDSNNEEKIKAILKFFMLKLQLIVGIKLLYESHRETLLFLECHLSGF